MSRKLLSILFISVLQADTPQKGQNGSKGSHSNPAHSATGQSSPLRHEKAQAQV
ncbi:hypothetical protein AAG906_031717 [Vitis piasezkii]